MTKTLGDYIFSVIDNNHRELNNPTRMNPKGKFRCDSCGFYFIEGEEGNWHDGLFFCHKDWKGLEKI